MIPLSIAPASLALKALTTQMQNVLTPWAIVGGPSGAKIKTARANSRIPSKRFGSAVAPEPNEAANFRTPRTIRDSTELAEVQRHRNRNSSWAKKKSSGSHPTLTSKLGEGDTRTQIRWQVLPPY
jgi:hypothetical protein